MRAIVYSETGPSSVLRLAERDLPEPGPGEVRVRLARAGVNPTDWKQRAGGTYGPLGPDAITPGQDGAGTVDALGEGVAGIAVGDRVWLYLVQYGQPHGTAAEYAVVPLHKAVPLPDSASFDVGAALGVPALTAHRALTSGELTDRIAQAFGTPEVVGLKVTVISFGFKYGIPVDADFVADMRFLPNPFWVPELRPHNGTDQDVADYVYAAPGAQEFLDGYVPVLAGVAPGYLREGKRFMRVALGCTGGKHRSVAMAEEIARRLRALGHEATTAHRDLGRE